MSSTIERRINFYKINFRKDSSDVCPSCIFNHIRDLPFDNNGKYFSMANGNSRCMFVEKSDDYPIKCSIGNRRNNNLPLVEESGKTEPLEIKSTQTLYEPMHFVIFNHNIIGAEYNSYAPRISSLEDYIINKAGSFVDTIEIIPLVNEDISKIIANMGNIKKFSFAVHKNRLQHIEELDKNMVDGIKKLGESTESDIIEVIIRPKKHHKKSISLNFLDKLPNFLSNHSDTVDTCKFKAEDISNENKIEIFNLLNNFVFSKKIVETISENQRHVNSDSVFKSIISAYNERYNDIKQIIKGK
ncbi:MAG: hypothetical protein LBV53_01120 [Mycoplasmataceae bacterium]|jgi:hypothetical protein|nr:hypothetical protein [Mycoplasmataceae bacterium]